mmetsp:Transcript_15113/g.18963  ORF Transcript_15113/g.18963 Transcript_15113/m.18963 type:complete len:608 (-) Transcript_15113:202-2025(-)
MPPVEVFPEETSRSKYWGYGSIDQLPVKSEFSTPKSGVYQTNQTQKQNRRIFLWGIVLLIGVIGLLGIKILNADRIRTIISDVTEGTLSSLKTDQAENPNVPNLIFLLIDDQGHGDMPYINEQLIELMPNIHELADTGVKFTQYYTESLCSPARAALMTGKYSIHTGMQHSLITQSASWGLPLGNPILPQILEHHGYVRRMVGKWHLGFYQPGFLPTNRGFESHFGYYGGQENYYEHSLSEDGDIWKDWARDGYPAEITNDTDNGYSLTLFADEVDNILISHDQSKPLFLYYATQATHAPLSDPPRHYITDEQLDYIAELTSHNGSLSQRELFLRTSVALDQTIGQMMATLKSTGMYENTIILAASDNGGCAFNGGNNYPLRGEKRTQWEGGVRTNGFVHSPLLADDAKGSTFNGLFHVTDWLPTILYGILGNSTKAEERKYDGIDQWEVIQGKVEQSARDQILYNIEIMDLVNDSFIAAYRQGPYKLVYGEVSQPVYTPMTPEVTDYCESKSSYGNQTTSVYNIPEDGSEDYNIVESLDDGHLSAMWYAIDGFWESSVKAAYSTTSNFRYKKVWLDHDSYCVPWVHYKAEQEREHLPMLTNSTSTS